MAIFDDDPRRDRPQPPSALRVATGRADGFVAPPLRYQASPRRRFASRRFADSTRRARHKRYRRLKTLCIACWKKGQTPTKRRLRLCDGRCCRSAVEMSCRNSEYPGSSLQKMPVGCPVRISTGTSSNPKLSAGYSAGGMLQERVPPEPSKT